MTTLFPIVLSKKTVWDRLRILSQSAGNKCLFNIFFPFSSLPYAEPRCYARCQLQKKCPMASTGKIKLNQINIFVCVCLFYRAKHYPCLAIGRGKVRARFHLNIYLSINFLFLQKPSDTKNNHSPCQCMLLFVRIILTTSSWHRAQN